MILNAQQIRAAVENGDIHIEPFGEEYLEAATYDLQVGRQGITTSTKKIVDLEKEGYVLVKPGDFAVITTKEEIGLGPQYAGRFGLRSKYARKGLIATTGPQIDPGFRGRLIIGLTNLTPVPVSIPFNDHVVSVEFHKLEQPTEKPYCGPFQGKTELRPEDIQMITEGAGMALSEVLTTLGSLSANMSLLTADVETLTADVSRLAAELTSEIRSLKYVIPIILTIGMAVLALIVQFK